MVRGGKNLRAILMDNEIGDLETLIAFKSLISQNIILERDDDQRGSTTLVISDETKDTGKPKIKTSQGFFGNVEDIFESNPDEPEEN